MRDLKKRQFNLFGGLQEIEVSCSYMKQILLEISVTETKSVSSVSQRAVRVRPKHKLSADLSMYSRRHKPDWRRKSAYLARTRFGAPSSNRVRIYYVLIYISFQWD